MPNWTDEQRAIFDEADRGQDNVIVRARAGTGKTTTIVEALNYAQESNILLAAFNKGIATELAKRVENNSVQVKTLHALGFKMVLRNWSGVKVDDDNTRASRLVERVYGKTIPDGLVSLARQLHTKVRELNPYAQTVEDVQHIAVSFDLLPDEDWEQRGWSIDRLAKGTLEILDAAIEQTDIIDFADMIFLPLACSWASPQFSLVMVDEAQDMSRPQLDLAQKVLRPDGRMFLVGDDKQAIYGFRGADSGALDRMKATLEAKELGLKTTFRCPKLVVGEANKLVPDLVAHPDAKPGSVNTNWKCTPLSEGAFVLSRTNAPLVKACLDLLRQGVPAIIKGKDIGRGLLKLIKKHYHRDLDTFLEHIEDWMTKEEKRAFKLGSASARNERLARVYDQGATLGALAEDSRTTDDVQDKVNRLFTDDAVARAVVCSTVHKAKGLESPEVWMLQDTFKCKGDEELNLRYVAITRSKDKLRYVSELYQPSYLNKEERHDMVTADSASVEAGEIHQGGPQARSELDLMRNSRAASNEAI